MINMCYTWCAATVRTTYELSGQKLDAASVTPNVLSAHLGKRWRAERNFWISFITFTLWWCGMESALDLISKQSLVDVPVYCFSGSTKGAKGVRFAVVPVLQPAGPLLPHFEAQSCRGG
jgi:hypothetical protein